MRDTPTQAVRWSTALRAALYILLLVVPPAAATIGLYDPWLNASSCDPRGFWDMSALLFASLLTSTVTGWSGVRITPHPDTSALRSVRACAAVVNITVLLLLAVPLSLFAAIGATGGLTGHFIELPGALASIGKVAVLLLPYAGFSLAALAGVLSSGRRRRYVVGVGHALLAVAAALSVFGMVAMICSR